MVNNAVVIQKHASDLAGEVAERVLDKWEDAVSNLLLTLVWILDLDEHSVEINHGIWLQLLQLHHHLLLLVDLWLLLLLLLLLPLHHLLLLHHHLLLLNGELLWVWSELLLHHLALSAAISWGLLLRLSLVVASTSSVVEVLLWAATVVHALTSLHVAALTWVAVHLVVSIWHTLGEEALEEVLLDLVLASVLALGVQLTAWHPVLDGESSSSEWV